MVDKQSCIIISIVLTVGISLAAINVLWTMFGPCSADVMLALDDSDSITIDDFKKVKGFVSKLANDKSIKEQLDKGNIQIGLATFSDNAKWMGKEDYIHDSSIVNNTLNNYRRMKRNTDIIKALEFVNVNMMKSPKARDDADKFLLFMTDGESEDSDGDRQHIKTIRGLADKLREEGVKIYVIAVGNNVNQDEIGAISSSECRTTENKVRTCKNSEKFLIEVDDFSGLDGVISELADQVCENQYWMAAIPIAIAILFVAIKLFLNRREVKMFDEDAKRALNNNHTEAGLA